MINYTDRLDALDAGHRRPRADARVHRSRRRARVRALRPLHAEGAFATCHALTLPASEPGYYFWRDRESGENHAPLGMVRHQVAGRLDRDAADRVPDVVRAAAVLRSVARPLAQGALLSGGRAVDGQARHGRPRAVSHRSGAHGHPADRARATAPSRLNCHNTRSSSRWQRWCKYLGLAAGSARPTNFSATISRRSSSGMVAWSGRRSVISRRSRSATSSGSTRSCRPNRRRGRADRADAPPAQPTHYTEDDLHIRQFSRHVSRRLVRKGRFKAA